MYAWMYVPLQANFLVLIFLQVGDDEARVQCAELAGRAWQSCFRFEGCDVELRHGDRPQTSCATVQRRDESLFNNPMANHGACFRHHADVDSEGDGSDTSKEGKRKAIASEDNDRSRNGGA